jgi:hypothetical protein
MLMAGPTSARQNSEYVCFSFLWFMSQSPGVAKLSSRRGAPWSGAVYSFLAVRLHPRRRVWPSTTVSLTRIRIRRVSALSLALRRAVSFRLIWSGPVSSRPPPLACIIARSSVVLAHYTTAAGLDYEGSPWGLISGECAALCTNKRTKEGPRCTSTVRRPVLIRLRCQGLSRVCGMVQKIKADACRVVLRCGVGGGGDAGCERRRVLMVRLWSGRIVMGPSRASGYRCV